MYVIWVVGAKPASRMSSIIRRRNGDMRRSFVDVEPPWSDPTKGYRIVPHARPKRFLGGAVSSTTFADSEPDVLTYLEKSGLATSGVCRPGSVQSLSHFDV